MSKYKARKSYVDGEAFDSAKEAARWRDLKLLERAGKITGLKRQERYLLIPAAYEDGKCLFRSTSYVADFVYHENGKLVVEDVKGYRGSTAYDVFKIKQKLMFQVYGIRVKEL